MVERVSASGRTTQTASTVQADNGSNYASLLLDNISKAAGSVSDYKTSELKKTQEADVVLQRNRAALNQRPTDTATQAGYVAHGVVGVQNKSLALTRQLEQESKLFEGNDEEWSAYTAGKFKELQDSTLAEYPAITDADQKTNYLGAITDIFSEQIPHLANVRISDSLEQEQIKRVNTFQDNLLLKMENLPPEELNKSLPLMLTENRAALQLTQQEVEKVLMNAAVVAAQTGDERLIDFTKTYKGEGDVPLFQKYGELQTASKKAKQVFAAENQGAMALAKDKLISQFEAGDLTFSQLATTVDANSKASGIPLFSDNELLGLKDARQRKIAKDTDYNFIINNDTDEPLAYLYGDKKDRDGIVNAYRKKYESVGEQIIARSGNSDPQFIREVKNRTNVELAKKLSDEELVNDDWKNRFKSLKTLNLENTDPVNGTLPENVSEVIDLWYSLDEGSRYAHADGDTSALLSNYELFKSQGQTDVQAIQLAQASVRNKKVVSTEVRKSAISKANDVADSLTQANWLEVFSDKEDAPDWYRDRFRSIVSDATFANIQAGYASPEAAAEAAGKAFEANYTRLNNGQLVFGQRKSLAATMAVNSNDIELTMDAYLQRNKTTLEDEALGASISEMYFDRPAGRDIVYIRSGINGMPISGPIPLAQLKLGRDAFIESQKATEKALAADTIQLGEGQSVDRFGLPLQSELAVLGQPTQPEMYKEQKVAEVADMKAKLNPNKAGYNTSTKVWLPEGDMIGYGHKLTKSEKSSGFIKVGDTEYNFSDGDSEVTDLIATKLMAQDNKAAEKALQLQWKNFDSLSSSHKRQLLIMYQAGDLTPDTSNKIKKAIEVGTEDLMSVK